MKGCKGAQNHEVAEGGCGAGEQKMVGRGVKLGLLFSWWLCCDSIDWFKFSFLLF